MTPPSILPHGRRILLDLARRATPWLLAAAMTWLYLGEVAESAEVWFKRQPGDRYWHRACTVTTAGVGPVEHYIPDGAVIAVRDGETLVIVSEGRR